MIEEIKKSITLMVLNIEQFRLVEHVFKLLGQEIVEVDSENAFNQITYIDYSPTREKWMVRNVVYQNEKTIMPLFLVLQNLCNANNIDFVFAHTDGITCVEAGGKEFMLGV